MTTVTGAIPAVVPATLQDRPVFLSENTVERRVLRAKFRAVPILDSTTATLSLSASLVHNRVLRRVSTNSRIGLTNGELPTAERRPALPKVQIRTNAPKP